MMYIIYILSHIIYIFIYNLHIIKFSNKYINRHLINFYINKC